MLIRLPIVMPSSYGYCNCIYPKPNRIGESYAKAKVALSNWRQSYTDPIQHWWTQDERLATSPYSVTRLHLPHVIVMRLHMRKSNVVILTPETTGTVSV